MDALTLQATPENYIITIDKKYIKDDFVLNLIERLQTEHLAEVIDFSPDIEEMGNEIKSGWWTKNKERLLGGKI